MQIRTITCHDVCNYGASLQAFALQCYLEKQGHDVKIIDYVPKYCIPYNIWKVSPASHLYKLSKYFRIVKLFWALRTYVHYIPTFPRKEAFDSFKSKYLKLTRHYETYTELASNPPEADIYIAGSDQIWRTNLDNGKDPAFYLQFGDEATKRISYAASFGLPNITDGREYIVRTFLTKFQEISVREDSGVKILQRLGLYAKLVVDPVFLLSKKEWIDILEIKAPKIHEPYLLVYDLNRSNVNMKIFAKYYARRYGVKIVSINDVRKVKYADINISNAGPEDFVNLIANAQFVLSDSFHATAISTIMHVPFRVYFEKPQAARISDFLKLIGLQKCMNCSIETEVDINWDMVQKRIDIEINSSKEYLCNNTR